MNNPIIVTFLFILGFGIAIVVIAVAFGFPGIDNPNFFDSMTNQNGDDDLVRQGDGYIGLQTSIAQVRESLPEEATTIGGIVDEGTITTEEASGNNDDAILNLTELFSKSQQSVVQITDATEDLPTRPSLGSGFVYDKNGHIVTNNHVISSGTRFDVTFADGTVYRAFLIGSDPYADVAVLYVKDVPKVKLVPLAIGNSSQLKVGQQVAAIGNPFGLTGSMTEGIVSGLDRLIPTQNAGGLPSTFSIPNVIQTDAAINPGNSGGPLLNTKGEVVGVNSAIFSTTGVFAGVGFAIPSNTVANIVPLLITEGFFQHPWLGVSGTNMTPEIAVEMGLSREPRGFLVVDVIEGSPADRAGIQGGDNPTMINDREIELGGDVIIEIDDREVRKIDDILAYLEKETQVGETITLTIWREEQIIEVDVTLAARPSL